MSNKKVFYRQCWLEKTCSTGVIQQVSFIPEEFSVIGKVIKLKESNNVWDNGWVVKSVGVRHSEDQLPDSHNDIKSLRKATGDSLPK